MVWKAEFWVGGGAGRHHGPHFSGYHLLSRKHGPLHCLLHPQAIPGPSQRGSDTQCFSLAVWLCHNCAGYVLGPRGVDGEGNWHTANSIHWCPNVDRRSVSHSWLSDAFILGRGGDLWCSHGFGDGDYLCRSTPCCRPVATQIQGPCHWSHRIRARALLLHVHSHPDGVH